jgi:hypothetical protein
MPTQIQNKLALFTTNAQSIKKEFIWQNASMKRMAALLYAQEGKTIDYEAIRQCHELIKQNTGAFSTFRGKMALSLAALLSLSSNPQRLFGETLKVYDLLKSVKFRASDFLVIAAYEIARQADSIAYMDTINRMRAFYDGMKANRFFSTGQDDYIFAAMLGLSDLEIIHGTERIEQLNNRLRAEFRDKNSVQALAQVLVLGGPDETSVIRVLALRDAFRAQKVKMDKSYVLSSLGVLALLPPDPGSVVRDISEANSTLRAQKGFGAMSVSSQEILLYAAAIVAGEYACNVQDGVLAAALSTNIANIIIAQQAAAIAAITAGAVSATTATTTSS